MSDLASPQDQGTQTEAKSGAKWQETHFVSFNDLLRLYCADRQEILSKI